MPGPDPRPRWPWRRLAAGYGVAGTAVLLAVGVVGDRTAATYTAALFSAWWLAPAPALLVLAAVRRAWRVVAALLVPAVAVLVLQGPYLVNRFTGDDAAADLRVAAYNVTHGRPLDGLRALVEQERPDVVLLQEVTVARRAELRALADYPHLHLGPLTGGRLGDGDAVLSRHPIVGADRVTGLPAGARATDLVTLDVDGRELDVLSVHLASPCVGCTPAGGEANPAGGTGEAARTRVAEARRYAEVVAGLVDRGRPVVLGGDLNSSPLNRPLHVLTRAGLTDVHRAVGTWPALTRGPGPGVARVDAVLVSGLRPLSSREGDRGASTHSPMVADLAWP
ncbi:endonuclease/exonuclease/phosphatase family protein [uncultured Modestobacter sp.]|uniref:endonuclease/exonuclease/phosphatase family protein n=1 Tax=uncultured Modestobacter sp. TaxID=380048 RepID=UPI0026098E86|nr:endonuclease/exonuclease/phosphatase family protein [uncultured Modestobacter sp.]